MTEETEYTCDFTGKNLGHSAPVHIEIWCGYPSDRDGVTYRLHLCDEALNELMTYLRFRIRPKKMGESASHYLEGMMGQKVHGGLEDSMSERALRRAVQKQIE